MAAPIAGRRRRRPDGRVVLPVRPPYDLRRTVQCGQAFGWRTDRTGITGVVAAKRVRLAQTAGGILVEGLSDERDLVRLRHYLGLDEPLEAVESELMRDRVLRRILPRTSGIALLRQNPWECLVSFIISAFNNIPKIELSLDRLTRQFGDGGADGVWSFPEPARLAGARLKDLHRCALGYRAPYVRRVARLLATGQVDLSAIGQMPFPEARHALQALPGVGEKVADCVLLFAYRRGEAFPVDVWVKRAVERWYFHGRRATARQIQAFARSQFGSLAGYAQQHLFYYARAAQREIGSALRVSR